MPTLTSFSQVAEALARLNPNATDRHAQSPEHMAQLMDFLGNPQDSYRTVHVAGTSGKTSTAYYTAALLQAAGKQVGLTISPHVDAINERVQIGLQPLPEAVFCREFGEFLDLIAASGIVPTYFEACTAFAFWQFARRRVDYAVVEVGIGGLADSTNVIHRPDKVCVITDIGYGHMALLGRTLPEIAAQKAGIIQLHNSVFCQSQAAEVMQPIRARAQQKQADLHEVRGAAPYSFLPGFQQRNFGLAEAAVQFTLSRDGATPLDAAAIESTARTHIPARMEVLQLGGKTIILDAAHNAQKVRALVSSVQAQFPGQAIAALFALGPASQEFIARTTRELMPLAPYVIATNIGPKQNARHILTAVEAKNSRGEVITDPTRAFAALQTRPEPILLVAGSFYLLNYVRPLVGVAPEAGGDSTGSVPAGQS